jgi:hypothetical protein
MATPTDISRAHEDAVMHKLMKGRPYGDSLVRRHDESYAALPNHPYQDLTAWGDEFLRMAAAEKAYNVFVRTYHYRPGDGAWATYNVMMNEWGRSHAKSDMFTMPRQQSVEISLGVFKQVPVGQMRLPSAFGNDAVLDIGSTSDPTYGEVLYLRAKAIKGVEIAVESLFDLVQAELEHNSIYKGQAVIATQVPTFMDLSKVNEANIVYAHHTARRLNYKLWSCIRLERAMLAYDTADKKVIWLYGDYGTGKSETALLLAKLCREHDWTFIFVPAGVPGAWEYALQMQQLYGREGRVAMFGEDAELLVKGDDPMAASRNLDQLDGIVAKATKNTLTVFTTNHMDQLSKGQTRYGRAFDLIKLGNLDRAGTERLAYIVLGDTLADDVDFDAVYAAMGGVEGGEAGITPAFMRQAYTTAKLVAIVDGGGTPGPVTTEAILDGVRDLQEQLNIHLNAPEPVKPETLGQAFAEVLRPMVHQALDDLVASEQFAMAIYDQAQSGADYAVENRMHQAKIIRESDNSTWARIATN